MSLPNKRGKLISLQNSISLKYLDSLKYLFHLKGLPTIDLEKVEDQLIREKIFNIKKGSFLNYFSK
jgi:hypothetical protein